MLILVVRFQREGYKVRKIIGQEDRRQKYEGSFPNYLRPISYLRVICELYVLDLKIKVFCKKCPNRIFKVYYFSQKLSESLKKKFITQYKSRHIIFCYWNFLITEYVGFWAITLYLSSCCVKGLTPNFLCLLTAKLSQETNF